MSATALAFRCLFLLLLGSLSPGQTLEDKEIGAALSERDPKQRVERLKAILPRAGSDVQKASILLGLGVAHGSLDQFDEAERFYRQVLDTVSAGSARVAALSNLGGPGAPIG